MTGVTTVDDPLVELAVAEARPSPDEYESDCEDDFFDREDEHASLTVLRSGRPIRAHFWLDF